MRVRQCRTTVNFSAAKAPAYQCLLPLGMATGDFVFPRRVFSLRVSLPLCQHTSPGPTQTKQSATWCAAAPETLVCSARPVKSRGAFARTSQAPMRWEDFILLRIKNFYPVKDQKHPYPSPKYFGLPGGICLPTQLQKVQADPRPDQRLWAPDRNTD